MANVSAWSTTATGNGTGSPPDFPVEGMARSAVNDTMRENMAAVARWYSDTDGSLTSTGTGSAYTLTSNSAHAALADQSLIVFRAHAANSATPTLEVDALGAKTMKVAGGSDLHAGAIAADQIVTVVYNATADTYNVQGGAGTRLVGEVIDYAGSTAPSGWLLAFGQAVSRTTYASLFAIISTTYGVGDGSTTFNLPDLRGRVVAGRDDMGGSAAGRLGAAGIAGGIADGDTLGEAGGSEFHTLTDAQMPVHAHPTVASGTPALAQGGTGVAGGSSTTGNTGNAGGDDPHNNTQPTIILNKLIYSGV